MEEAKDTVIDKSNVPSREGVVEGKDEKRLAFDLHRGSKSGGMSPK